MIDLTKPMSALLESKAHRFTSLWTITRTDSTVMRFTSHTRPITFEGQTYSPMTVADASAQRAEAGLRERNMEFVGYLSSGEIEADDLRVGSYNGAQVTEQLIDWKYPWQGVFYTNVYFITEVRWTGETWEAQIDGLTTKLRQAKGVVIGRRCRYVLGDTNCGVALAGHTDSGTVASVPEQRKRLYSNLTSEVAGYYNNGLLVFTSGDNDGLSVEVEQYLPTNGEFILALPADYDIAASDTFDVYPGCDKSLNDCRGTSGTNGRPWLTNVENFGGFPHVPGTTTALKTPSTK